MGNSFEERYYNAIINKCRCKMEDMDCWKKEILSEADTFIEFCFERACAEMYHGMEVLDEWRQNKHQYVKITSTTIYDFQHYSRHDASHSISILEAVEMVIGDMRIVMLSRGDLWLLLEAAYSHDMGMAMTGSQLCELWRKKEFESYIFDCLSKSDIDEVRAAGFYKQMDNLLHDKAQMEDIDNEKIEPVSFEQCWPIKISNYMEWLVTNYIRKEHGARNARARERITTVKEPAIPLRLYEYAVVIAGLHTEDYRNIMENLPYEEKGIGVETVHPRFAAAMLRLGDVLDMDNNRFSIYAMEHLLEIPELSMQHYQKHQAIRSIQISTEEICFTAVAADLKVCQETGRWFQAIDNEVNSLISAWNIMASPELKGCTLRPSVCKIYYEDVGHNKVEYHTSQQRYFEVNRQKLIDLLIGTNIYDMKMDFVREYIQNALDASKMQLWQDIQNGEYNDVLTNEISDYSRLMPYQLPDSIYEKYKVRLKLEIADNVYDTIRITIEDNGIGMEKECLQVISSPGSGWRKREKYNKVINNMPRWLRPTGGFGIGIQSAFMAADKILIITQGQEESVGRRIMMESPKKGGEITTEDFVLGHHGTKVQIEAPISLFLEWNDRLNEVGMATEVEFQRVQKGVSEAFSREEIERYVQKVLVEYLQKIIPNSLFPITIASERKEFPPQKVSQMLPIAADAEQVIRENKKYTGGENERNKDNGSEIGTEEITTRTIIWRGEKYYVNAANEGKLTIWDCHNSILFNVEWIKDAIQKRERSVVCYKNVRMTKEIVTNLELFQKFSMFIDYMGLKAEESLKIHRNEFNEAFDSRAYIMKYMETYFHICTIIERKRREKDSVNKKEDSVNKKKNYEFWLARILFTDRNEFDDLENAIKENWRDGEKPLKRSKLKIQFIRREQKPEEKTKIEYLYDLVLYFEEESVSLIEFAKEYRQLIEGAAEDYEHAFKLLFELKPEKNVTPADASYISNKITDWVKQHLEVDTTTGTYHMKAEDDTRDDIYELIFRGVYKCDAVGLTLFQLKDFERRKIVVFSDENQDKGQGINGTFLRKGIFGFWRMMQITDKVQEKEQEFYAYSFNGKKTFGITVLPEAIHQNRYPELLVDMLPYGTEKIGRTTYLISPISDAVAQIYERKSKKEGEDYLLHIGEFVQDVMSEETYEFVVSWTAGHAVQPASRGNKKLIGEKYREYLENIYEQVLEKRRLAK